MITIKTLLECSKSLQPYPLIKTVLGSHSRPSKRVLEGLESSLVTSITEDINILHKKLEEHYKNLESDGIKALRKYTDDSASLNSHLYDTAAGKETSYADKMSHKNHITKLDKVLKSNKTPEDMTVYSGVYYSPEHKFGKRGTSTTMKVPAYMSTSINHKVAADFGHLDDNSEHNNNKNPRHVLKIHVPEGSHGSYVGGNNISHVPAEKEFILPRNTKLHIHHTPEYHAGTNTVVWSAHIKPKKTTV